MCVHVGTWRPEDNLGCCFPRSTLLFETGPLTGLELRTKALLSLHCRWWGYKSMPLSLSLCRLNSYSCAGKGCTLPIAERSP